VTRLHSFFSAIVVEKDYLIQMLKGIDSKDLVLYEDHRAPILGETFQFPVQYRHSISQLQKFLFQDYLYIVPQGVPAMFASENGPASSPPDL
jgi:hypothetical protein